MAQKHYRLPIVWALRIRNAPAYLLKIFIWTSVCFGRRTLRYASRGDFVVGVYHVLALSPDRKGRIVGSLHVILLK